MDDYAEAVRRFYEVYRPIARRHNLRLHSKFSMYDDGFIKIFQGEGQDKKQIIKVEEKDDALCNRRADAAESEPPGRQQHIVGAGRWLLRDRDRRSIGRKEE